MVKYAFDPPVPPSVAISGSEERFPVRRVVCVGRNYAAHAREMGKDPDRDPPFFFTKPADAVTDTDIVIPYPPETENFHYEIELVVAIGSEAVDIEPKDASSVIWGYAVGIDLTRRDLQLLAREQGRPWDWGKAFDLSAPIAPLHRAGDVGVVSEGRIWLAVNGEIKQDADIADLIWSVSEIVSTISKSITLKPGDLIMTGTPAGVGPVVPGDVITGGIEGLGEIKITIAERDRSAR